MAQWSWSKLQTARKCPLALHLEHYEKVPKSIPEFLHAGRANHSVLEEASRRCFLSGAPRSVELVAEEMREEFEGGAFPKADPKIFDRLEDCIGSAPIPQLGELLLLEKKFLVDAIGMLEEDGTKSKDAYCSGLGDHIVVGPDRLVVWDWKTGWGSGRFVDIDQVILYAGMTLAWLVDNGHSCPTMVEVGIKHSFVPKHDLDMTLTAEATRHRYGELLREMTSMDQYLDSAERPAANFGEHCSTCFVSASCPIYRERTAEPSIWEGHADAWAMRAVLKKELAKIEDYLKKELHSAKQLDVGADNPLRFKTSPTVGIDATKAYVVLREFGVTSAMFLAQVGLTKTGLNKLVKDKEARERVMLEASYVKSERNTMTTTPEAE